MKRLIGVFIFLLICMSSPVYADNHNLVQYIGDSYTEGYSSDGMITGDDVWYAQASHKAGLDYTQESYGGIGFVAKLSDKTFSTLLDDGEGKNAKYVVIAGGYNDMAYSYDTIKNKVYETVKKAQRLYPDAKILVGMTGDATSNRTRFKNVIQGYKDGTKEAGGLYITNSEYALNGNKNYFASDGYHPNVTGHHAIGETIGGYLMKCEDIRVNSYASTITIGAGTYATSNGHFMNTTGIYHNYYMVDGIADQSITGAIKYKDEYYKVDAGRVDTSYTGPWTYNGTTYYLINGHTNKNMNGPVKYKDCWYYVENGIVINKNIVVYFNGDWYYIHNGKLDKDYTGLADYNGKTYYIVNGKVNSSCNGLTYINGEWCYLVNGVLDTGYNNLILYNGTWYYVQNGKINWNYTNLVQYYGTWYYVENGQINWNKTTLSQVDGHGTWYYVENGKINWNYQGLTYFNNEWYYIHNGVHQTSYSNLVLYNGTWYYVKNGKIDWHYTNLVQYCGTWYFVENGKINWNKTTLSQVDGHGTWYYIENSQINWRYTGLTYYFGTWYYIQNGTVNWSYNGLVYYQGTWFYVHNGQIDWNYSNLVLYNGTWYYVDHGKINWNKTTLSQVDGHGTWYYVENGQINWSYNGYYNNHTIHNGVVC